MGIRWKKILLIVAIAALVMLLTPVVGVAIHRHKVNQAGGVWCVQIQPDGRQQFLYGVDCGL